MCYDGGFPAKNYIYGYELDHCHCRVKIVTLGLKRSLGYVPTGTRSESLDPKHPLLKNLHCEEVDIQSDECISLKALVVSKATPQSPTDVIVLYLQGELPSYFPIYQYTPRIHI